MEKNQYNLCLEILRRFNKSGVLENVILIGSWCVPFYQEYFVGQHYSQGIKTRDIDFLIPSPQKIKTKIDVFSLIEDLGFVVGFQGAKGYIKLEHPELIVEFLVPEKGKGTNKPYPLPQLGVNAVSLRFLNLLAENTILAEVGDVFVRLPHPANFALHKLIISERRPKKEKADKDTRSALGILQALIRKGDQKIIRSTFDRLPQQGQKKVIAKLNKIGEEEIIEILQRSSI